MKLHDLFAPFFTFSQDAFSESEVSGVFNDARLVTKGSVFVAIKGNARDAHEFIPQAIMNGALALVVEERSRIPEDYRGFVLQVPNSREVLDILAARFHQDPGQELFCFGVTGTNGKTSVTYMIESILTAANVPTGVIGTVNHHLGDRVWETNLTTPDPVFLQERLRQFREAGAKAVAMEVSSHALDQKRVDSVPFNTVIFTNLTRDHLDYHKTMENYHEAKQRLFTDLLWKTTKVPCFAIINIDDKYGRRMRVADPAILWTYGAKNADITYKITSMDFTLTEFKIKTPLGEADVSLPMAGVHNVMNSLAAIGAGLSAGVPLEVCVKAIGKFTGVPGRLQSVPNSKNLSVFVDYAHSPDALENVLQALQKVRSNLESSAKIWTIFGCGGDRDKGKRPLMAQMALQFSDKVVVTSDNPRTEDPAAIISDIMAGIPDNSKNQVQMFVDRKEAITKTLQQAAAGDVILIAGKGHEDYQIIGTTKFPFSDVKIVEEVLGG
jgi:UDP-N-acetylmuramyl-tripeptide synthetase